MLSEYLLQIRQIVRLNNNTTGRMDQSIDVVVDVCVGMVTMVSVSSVSMARMIE